MSKEEPTFDDYVDNRAPEQIEAEKQGNMTLIGHLDELRKRIIRSLIAVCIGSMICYFFIDQIVAFITAPAGKLYYMRPAEAFFIYLKTALAAGFLLGSPVIFYQIWAFFLPALTAKEKAVLGLVVPVSIFLFIGGIAFSYFFVLPIGLKFFMGFASEGLQPLLSMESYLDFVFMFLLPFGLVFELPLIIILLAKLGIVNSAMLKRSRRYIIFAAFIIAALLTPPDIVSQVLLAVPLILLYEISYIIVKYVLRK